MNRKSNSRSSKANFRAGDYVPIWTPQQTDTCNLIFKELMEKGGVHDVKSYFDKLLVPVIICSVIGAVWGAYSYGFGGFLLGVVLGASAPAWLLWLGVLVCYSLVIVGVYLTVWVAIIFLAFWLLSR